MSGDDGGRAGGDLHGHDLQVIPQPNIARLGGGEDGVSSHNSANSSLSVGGHGISPKTIAGGCIGANDVGVIADGAVASRAAEADVVVLVGEVGLLLGHSCSAGVPSKAGRGACA